MVRTTNPDIEYLAEELSDCDVVMIKVVQFPKGRFSIVEDIVAFKLTEGSALRDELYEVTREHAAELDSGKLVLFCQILSESGNRDIYLPPSMRHHAEIVAEWSNQIAEDFAEALGLQPLDDA